MRYKNLNTVSHRKLFHLDLHTTVMAAFEDNLDVSFNAKFSS